MRKPRVVCTTKIWESGRRRISVFGPYVRSDCSERRTEARTTVGCANGQQKANVHGNRAMPWSARQSTSTASGSQTCARSSSLGLPISRHVCRPRLPAARCSSRGQSCRVQVSRPLPPCAPLHRARRRRARHWCAWWPQTQRATRWASTSWRSVGGCWLHLHLHLRVAPLTAGWCNSQRPC